MAVQARSRPLASRVAYGIFQWTRILGSGRIAKLGSPKTIVDVGVANGTPELYKAFPEASLLLIEPLAECEPHLKAICDRRPNSRYVLSAVGARKEQKEIQFVPGLLEHSSFLSRTALTTVDPKVETRVVNVTTLDDILKELAPAQPFGLKIDTEGFELDVIQGATEFLKQTQFVIAEVSILKRFEGSYSFAAFIAEMSRHGFDVYDILHVVRPDASGTRYADIAFLNSAYR